MTSRVQKRERLGQRPRDWLPARKWLPDYDRRWLKGGNVSLAPSRAASR